MSADQPADWFAGLLKSTVLYKGIKIKCVLLLNELHDSNTSDPLLHS